MDLYRELHRLEVSNGEVADLTMKCQENIWLRLQGCAWEDDPFMEEYPYDFARTDDMEILRQYLKHGNWAIRQGILYRDLAFINQENGGDEWWTLKRLDDGGWLAFESWTFGSIVEDARAFAEAIVSMEMATPEECHRLVYMLPKSNIMWSDEAPDATSSAAAFKGISDSAEITITRGADGASVLEVRNADSEPARLDGFASPFDAALLACKQLGFERDDLRGSAGACHEFLVLRAARLREASLRMDRSGATRERAMSDLSDFRGRLT